MGSGAGGEEKIATGIMAKVMAQDAKGARGIAKIAGGLAGRLGVHEIGAQSLVLALFGRAGFEEEAARIS
jgi:hypothetical protein